MRSIVSVFILLTLSFVSGQVDTADFNSVQLVENLFNQFDLLSPAADPSAEPTAEPSQEPTPSPTNLGSFSFSGGFLSSPSVEPTAEPTFGSISFSFSAPIPQPSTAPVPVPTPVPVPPTPSVAPTANPSAVPTFTPSAAPTYVPTPNAPTYKPTRAPSAKPTVKPSYVPGAPTASPNPTAVPSISPTLNPTTTRTSSPTYDPTPPVLTVSLATKTRSTIVLSVTYLRATYSGTIYCAAFPAGFVPPATGFSDLVVTSGVSAAYAVNSTSATVTVGGLNAVVTYDTYCSVVNTFGMSNTRTNVVSTLVETTTSCCKQITFTKNPAFLYGDVSKYTSSNLPKFQYVLSSAPASKVKITPTVFNSTGDRVPSSVVTVTPAVAVFRNGSALTGSFYLSASPSLTGTYTISLVASSTNAADYESNVYKMTTILNAAAKVPAPSLLNAKFSNTGASIVVTFDSITNKALITKNSFPCCKLLDFNGVNKTTCSFTSLSTVNIAFGSVPYGTQVLSVNDLIYLGANKIKAACVAPANCTDYAFANRQSTAVLTADSPVAPVAVLRTVATASVCDPFTIDPTMSTGSGGRSWKSVTWSVTAQTLGSPITDVAITDVINTYGPITTSKINIDKSLLSPANYVATLTVVNMFDLSSTATAAWTVDSNPNLPLISIAGPKVVDVLPSDVFTLSTSSARTSCAVGTTPLKYSWTVSTGGTNVSIHSVSASPTKFMLNAYTLSPQTVYTVTFTALAAATTAPVAYPAIGASASVTVRVGKGSVVAVVLGGSFRSTSAQNGNLTLDASTSYDQTYRKGSTVVGETLSFSWSCRTTSAATYGSSCADKLPQVTTAAQLNVVSSILAFNELYEFTVTASAADGRFSTYAVTVQSSQGSTYTTINNAALTKVNPTSAFVLTGAVRAGYAVDATWSAFIDDMSQTFTATTPLHSTFTAKQVHSLLSFPLSVPANTFAAGSVVTFRLFANRAGNATQFPSTTELMVTMNSPPSGGMVTVDPAIGDSLTDVFSINALSWTDDASDLPLSYEFSYQMIASQTPMTVQSKSTSNSVSTTLPAGLSTLDFQVTVVGKVYDSFLASTTATATVVVNVVESFDVAGYVTAQVAEATSTGNTDQLAQIVANAANVVNAVNCTLATKSLCDSLNRNQCFATPQKCSACLDGYTGLAGDRNTMCRNDGAVLGTTGASCASNDDCALGQCTNSQCVVPVLECPSNNADVCSGKGECVYTNQNNKNYGRTCLITDTDCIATCQCVSGFGGSACQLSAEDVVGRDLTRGALCNAIITRSTSEDTSSFLLDSLINALYNAYDPDEVVQETARTTCYDALAMLAELSAAGYLSVESRTHVVDVTAKFVTDAAKVSNGIVPTAGRRLEESDAVASSNAVNSAVTSIVFGILGTMADGEDPIAYTNNQVNMIVYKSLAANLTELLPNQEDLSTYVELAGLEVADTLQTSTGYLEASALLWLTNPFPNSTELESSLFRLEVYGDFPTARRTQESVRNGSEAAFYYTTQFTSEQDFNFTLSLDDALRLGPSNFTIPQCSYYADSGYQPCQGCWVDTYTNYNVTYGCPLAAFYDVTSTQNRLLQATNSQSTQFASTLTNVNPRIFNPFNNSFDIDWGIAKIVLAFLSTLTFIIVLGFIFFSHTDYVESHTVALYAAEGKQADQKQEGATAAAGTPTAAGLAAAGSSPKGSAKVEYDDIFEATTSAKKQFMEKEIYVSNVVANFLDSVMPEESLQTSTGTVTWVSFLTTMLKHHKYTALFFHSTVKFPRTLRWASITMAFLLNLFFVTIFFGVFYPDDGTCQDRTGIDNCLASDSSATNTNLCVWKIDQTSGEGFCDLNEPPHRFVYIITVVIVIVVISAPFQVIYDYILYNWCVRRPRFEDWGYTTPAAPVSTSVDNKAAPIQALYERRNANRVPVTSSARVQYVLDADNFTADQVYDTQMSVTDESRQILQESHDYLQKHANAPQLAWQNGQFNSSKQIKANAIQQHVGINPDGTPVALNAQEKVVYGTPQQKLVSTLNKARSDADVIEQRLKACGAEVQAKDTLLIQHFILEQFSPIKQFVLRRHMFNDNMTTQMTVSPLVWVLAWTWIILSMAFFLAWAFAWAATEGGHTAAAWGIVLGTALAQDVLVIQVFRVYIIYSLSMVSIKPQLQYIYRVLNKVAISYTQDEIADNYLDVRVCQHLSPSCRAAHSQIAYDLATATILRHIDDADVSMCRVKHEVHLATLAAVVLAVPVAFAIINETLGSIILEALLPAFFDAVLIMNRYFWSGAGFFILLPYLLFIVVYLWYTRVHKPAHQQLNAHKRGETSDLSVKRWQTAERGAKSKGFFASASENCMAAAFYVSRPALIVQAASDAWFGVYDPVYDAQWSAMNRPVYMQALVSERPVMLGTNSRAERLAEKESDLALQEVLKRRIPEEVSALLVASKTHWLEAWTNKPEDASASTDPALPGCDTRYVSSMMSYRLNHVHRAGPTPRAPHRVDHDGITHSPRALEFTERHGAVLTAEEAVIHILRNYRKYVSMGRMSLVDAEESNDLYTKEANSCDVLIEFFDLRILLEEALSVYQPLGVALTHEEKDEIVDSCYAWLVQHGDAFLETHYNHDANRIAAATLARINHSQSADSGDVQSTNFSVPFQQFRRWFLSTGSAVTRYRQQQQSEIELGEA